MNPLFFLLIVGGGYYFWDKNKKKEADRQRALEGETCVVVARQGFQLVCDENACRGLEMVPGVDPDDPVITAFWTGRMNNAINAVMGTPPASAANDAQARLIVNRMFGGVFPECQWAELPPSTPIGAVTIQDIIPIVQLVITGMIVGNQQQGGGIEPPLPMPGEQTLDRDGLRMYMAGPVCVRTVSYDDSEANWDIFQTRLNTAWAPVAAFPPTYELAEQVLANTFKQYFPECAWPPHAQWTFQEDDGEFLAWDKLVLGILAMMESAQQGVAAMKPTPGNLGQLGKLAMAQQQQAALSQNPGLLDQLQGTYRQGVRALKSAY